MGIKWTKKPSQLAIGRYACTLERAVQAMARESAMAMEADAKTNAPWQDDTGAARAGLKGIVEETPAGLRIVLMHSVEYGVHLEFARGGRYAILWPTIEAEVPRLKAELKRIVG